MSQNIPTIALAGNPNSGKTSLFNAITGLKYKVGNYPGVTVDKKVGKFNLEQDSLGAEIYDLPGIYSLSGESEDEKVAAKSLEQEPDLIVVVLDASNLERNLYLLTELIDLGIPIVVALNMVDVASNSGIKVYNTLLSKELDLPVVNIVASKKEGLENLKSEISKAIRYKRPSSKKYAWANQNNSLISVSIDHFKSGDKESLVSAKNYGAVASARYKWINQIVKKVISVNKKSEFSYSDTVDKIATHKVWGLILFIFLMTTLFQALFYWAQYPMEVIDSFVSNTSNYLNTLLPDGLVKSLIIDGVLAGVGSVIIFIPQIALLFFFIGLLEDSGYLTRAAFVMDRVMRVVGLQGRSFIPLLSSFACAVPGIMSTRTIASVSDRLVTILVAPLMSCSARLPVYAVLIAAFIPNKSIFGFIGLQGLTLLAAYLLGVIVAAIAAFILKKYFFKGEPALYVMEMPPFRKPNVVLVLRDVWDRVKLFIKEAGTVILACSVVLWFLASFPFGSSVEESYAGAIGKFIEPVILPLGFNWELGIAILASFAAREVFISSLATVYNLSSTGDSAQSLTQMLIQRAESGEGFSLAVMLSLMVFFIFACQCMSTLAVCKKETGTWKWPIVMFVYMTVVAYVASYFTYNLVKVLT